MLNKDCLVNNLPKEVEILIMKKLTLNNPEYIKAVNRKEPFWRLKSIPKKFEYFEKQKDGSLRLPKGFVGRLIEDFIMPNKLKYKLHDTRTAPRHIDGPYRFNGELRKNQIPISDAVELKQIGVINASTGFGKSVLATWMFCKKGVRTLITTNRSFLVDDFISTITQFTGIPKKEIGLIKGKKFNIRDITIASIQTLAKLDNIDEIKNEFGMVIFDEVHENITPSRQFLFNSFNAKYHYGLSATIHREDGQGEAIKFYCGSVIAKYDAPNIIPDVQFVKTNYTYSYDDDYVDMVTDMSENTERNDIILSAILSTNGAKLVLAKRKDHCKVLCEELISRGGNAMLLNGDVPTKRQDEIRKLLQSKDCPKDIIILGSMSLIATGFDAPILEKLFLIGDLKAESLTTQGGGRVLRLCEGKSNAKIYDFVDPKQPILLNQSLARRRVYRKMKFNIL